MQRAFDLSVRLLIAIAVASVSVSRGEAAETAAPAKDVAAQRKQAIDRGLEYLATKGQAADGTFSIKAGPGLTALALTAALRNGRTVDDPMVAKGLKALEGFVKPDGGIYGSGRTRNYETCVSVVCLQLANKDGRYKKVLADADKFLRGLQFGAADADQSDPWYGGVGYGGPERPDVSNTSYLIDALHAAGSEEDAAAIQRAIVFVSRCQNLKSQFNDTKLAGKVNDGGFYYTIPKKDESLDSERYDANGGLRSYGSMTYSGFKSLIYAGLTQDDPRTKAAMEWIHKNYTVENNPGQGDAGLYYYYHAFAAALQASKLNEVAAADGKSHDWRNDLVLELAKRQNADGSWTNSNRQWFENDGNLSTAFALIALSYSDPSKTQP